MKRGPRFLLCLLTVLGLVASCRGADAQTQQRDPGIPANFTPASVWAKRDYQVGFWRLARITKDYQLGPGDILQIDVYGAPSLSDVLQSTPVNASGDIVFPLLGPVKAAGLTAEDLEREVAAQLKRRGLIEKPEVLVTVLEYQAKAIYVVGQVDNPGQYVMSQPWTVTEAVLIAGGLDLGAGKYGYLHRRTSSDAPPAAADGAMKTPEVAAPGYEVITFDLQPLKQGGILQPDLSLRDGDILIVSTGKTEMVYVIGDVVRQGAVALASGSAPVSRVLSAAGGLTRTANGTKGIVVRYDSQGRRQEMPVDYRAILDGKQPDFQVQANDLIYVPGSAGKTFGLSVLNTIPQVIKTAAVIAIIP